MHVPEMMILEIVDPATGEPLPNGEAGAVCASVFNPYRPLVRFCNGDRGILIDEPCLCGRTAVRFRFAGRIDEAAKVRGMFVYPQQIATALEHLPQVRAWRAIVASGSDGLDVFTVEIEGAADPAEVADAVRAQVRVRADVSIVEPGTIEEAGRLIDRRGT
jgi:phenylacetate-CoA ligase